jgi:hypothetical protein
LNWTVPVGVPEEGRPATTTAERVTGPPSDGFFGDTNKVRLVDAFTTDWVRVPEELL